MSENESGGMTAIVAIVAIVIIVGLGFYVFRNFSAKDGDENPSINVELPASDGNAN